MEPLVIGVDGARAVSLRVTAVFLVMCIALFYTNKKWLKVQGRLRVQCQQGMPLFQYFADASVLFSYFNQPQNISEPSKLASYGCLHSTLRNVVRIRHI